MRDRDHTVDACLTVSFLIAQSLSSLVVQFLTSTTVDGPDRNMLLLEP